MASPGELDISASSELSQALVKRAMDFSLVRGGVSRPFSPSRRNMRRVGLGRRRCPSSSCFNIMGDSCVMKLTQTQPPSTEKC